MVGCRLPIQSEARDGADVFYAIFPLAEQKTFFFLSLLIGWARAMFGWAEPPEDTSSLGDSELPALG